MGRLIAALCDSMTASAISVALSHTLAHGSVSSSLGALEDVFEYPVG